MLWTQVFSVAYFCNMFHPNAAIHGHVWKKHQEEYLQDWQHCVFGQYTWIDTISALQDTHLFFILIPKLFRILLSVVPQTSLSPPCTFIFHKFTINYQNSGGKAAALEFFSHAPSSPSYVVFSLFKDSELNELRKTIELLKKQNAAAQAAINGVINTPELNCKGERQAPHTETPGLSSEASVLWVKADVTISNPE